MGKRMRVVLHMGDPYTLDNPCTKRISAIATELKKRGHEPIILAPDIPEVEKVDGVIYCKTIPLKKKTSFERLKNQCTLAISSYRNGKKVPKVDVVFTTCPPPLINYAGAKMAKKHKAKLIYDVRDIWPDVALEMGSFTKESIYAKTFEIIKKFMIKKADLVTAVSDGKVSKLQKLDIKKKVINAPNGFNTDFLNAEINQELFRSIRSKGSIICSYIGNIGLAQGTSQLIAMAEKCKAEKFPIHFVIYGSGVEENKLQALVDEKALGNISFEGRLPNKKMRTVLAASDFNFVSLVNGNLQDSIPTKLYEALGVGCPVFLVAEGDSTKVLGDTKLGVSVPPNDIDNMWDSFKHMYYSLDAIKQNKDYAMNKIKHSYSLQKTAKDLVDEMECLVKGI
jgi:glycosyltransferase involved in cell wall biosynthesis